MFSFCFFFFFFVHEKNVKRKRSSRARLLRYVKVYDVINPAKTAANGGVGFFTAPYSKPCPENRDISSLLGVTKKEKAISNPAIRTSRF